LIQILKSKEGSLSKTYKTFLAIREFRGHYTYLRAFAAGFGPGRCRASVRPDRASSAAMKASEPSGGCYARRGESFNVVLLGG
jgi:hypothetical protein